MKGMKGKYRCYDCGGYFNYPRIEHEDRGECWGLPAFEDVPYCPLCKWGDFDKAEVVDADFEEEGR